MLVPLVAAVAAPVARADVHLVSITPSVHRGGYVTLQVITYETALCSVRVHHGTSRPLVDPALAPKENHLLGALRWRWRMPAASPRGRWLVDVACRGAGTLRTSFVVT